MRNDCALGVFYILPENTRTTPMRDMYDINWEKPGTVSPSGLAVYGVAISTRHGCAIELAEMIDFVCIAFSARVSHHISHLFYDTSANLCTVCVNDAVEPYNSTFDVIADIGNKTLTQFILTDASGNWLGDGVMGGGGERTALRRQTLLA